MADRTVPTTDTFDEWRQTYNLTGQDVGEIANLNTPFTATPTNLVEAVNSKTTTGFSIAMAIALG